MKRLSHPYYSTQAVVAQSPKQSDRGSSLDLFGAISETVGSAEGGLMLFALLIIAAISIFTGGEKRKLTSAKWADRWEKLAAFRQLKQQICKRKASQVGLYCGAPPKPGIGSYLKILLTGELPTVPVCDANRGILVVGSAGSGKTYSAINPMIFAAIEQNLGCLVYDYKGEQKWIVATQAVRSGYDLQIFAPGKPWTCAINPVLDFIEKPTDTLGAKNLAKVLYRNTLDADASGDPFFEPASQQLVQALLQLARATPYPDLAMAYAILRLPDMPKRVLAASKKKELYSTWVREQFSQIAGLAEEDAGKTTGGIIAGAQNLLLPFIQPDLMACFIGKSTADTYIKDGQMLVFENDINRQEVLAPILAAIIHMTVLKNFAQQRKTGLLLAFDEVPTITLEDLAKYPAEFRSKGCVTLLGLQNKQQLAKAYGDKQADIIISNMSTKFFFNPAHVETAEDIVKYTGETEVTYKTSSISRNFGMGSGGGSRGLNETTQTKPLLRVEEVLEFKRDCVLLNPAYENSERGSIPCHFRQIKIPKSLDNLYRDNERIWHEELERNLIAREQRRLKISDSKELDRRMEEEMDKRIKFAEDLLPMPENKEADKKVPVIPGGSGDKPIDI